MTDKYHVRTLHTLDEMRLLVQVADVVWGPPAGSMVSPDFLMALSHTGGYVAGLFEESTPSPTMIGCSFGMLARFRDEFVLHSHITGISPRLQHAGLGRLLKRHQSTWARDNGLTTITWTFDPLVRRNGWFNLHCLGATAEEYHVDFYGPLGDSINGIDETDRLVAQWDLTSTRTQLATDHTLPAVVPEASDVLVSTPHDIVTLRTQDPPRARTWRRELRQQLTSKFDSSHIVGMTSDGSYVLRPRGESR